MNLKIVGLAIVLVALAMYLSDPYHTKLPLGSTDLNSVEKQLAKLKPEERKLVESYVKRSNGNVLPPSMADPEEPFTARNFAEAIELQLQWNEKMAVFDKQNEQRESAHEARLEPLRAIVSASIAKAGIETEDESSPAADYNQSPRPYVAEKPPHMVFHIRVQNLGDTPVSAFRGALKAKDSKSYLPRNICWIDNHVEELAAHSEKEILCGYRGIETWHREFLADKSGQFTVYWEPHYIKLANGSELASD